MANFILRNPLNLSKAVSVGITYKQIVDTNDDERELIWVVELATDELTVSGTKIPPEILHIRRFDSLDEEIRRGVERLAAKIDWTPLAADIRAPIIDEIYPDSYIASIYDDVRFKIIDPAPAAGIDLASVKVFINDIDVSNELMFVGNAYECEVIWRPSIRVFDTYE